MKNLIFSIVCVMLIIAVSTDCVQATIKNVPGDCQTIQECIDASSGGDTIRVAPGTYYENLNYNGHNVTVASWYIDGEDTSYISQTVIDGGNSGTVVTFENGENSAATIVGFTIQNGSAQYGGGISCLSNSSPTIIHNIVSYNSAGELYGNGGGIYCSNSNPIINENTISSNTVGEGGGIKCINSSPTITGNTIANNSTSGGINNPGGGIYCGTNSNPIINGNTISGNSTSGIYGPGGGIFCAGNSNPTISSNIINGNSASDRGGGISCYESSPLITSNTIRDNTGGDGAGIHFEISNSSIDGNIISNNVASDGAGILCESSTLELRNNIINDNSASLGENCIGGGINCRNSDLTIVNNTLYNNLANDYGGGISCNEGSNLEGSNNILWANTSSNGSQIYTFGGTIGFSYSDIEGGWEGEGNIDCDPQFCGPDTGNFYLDFNSCCVGAGQNGEDIGALGVGCGFPLCADVEMVPDNDPPIIVPPGGSFGLTGTIGNPTEEAIVTDVWVGVQLYDIFIQLWEFPNIPLQPGQSFSSHLNQHVPVSAAPGTYKYYAFCGDYDGWTVCDSASFEFTVTGALGSGGASDWILDGGWNETEMLPNEVTLSSNYPNPFNASTQISYSIPEAADVKLEVFNLLGQRVAALEDGLKDAGNHTVTWDASDMASGIYFYKLTAGDKIFTKRMTLLK